MHITTSQNTSQFEESHLSQHNPISVSISKSLHAIFKPKLEELMHWFHSTNKISSSEDKSQALCVISFLDKRKFFYIHEG